MFWKASKTPLALALIAVAIAKECRNYTGKIESGYKITFVKIEKTFLDNAIRLICKAWRAKQVTALHMISRPIRNLGQVRVIDIASYIDSKEFIALPPVQFLTEISWKSGFRIKFLQSLKAMLVIPVQMWASREVGEYLKTLKPTTTNSDMLRVARNAQSILQQDQNEGYEDIDTTEAPLLTEPDCYQIPSSSSHETKTPPNFLLSSDQENEMGNTDQICNFYKSPLVIFLLTLMSYLFYVYLISKSVISITRSETVYYREITILVFNVAFLLQSLQSLLSPNVHFGYKLHLWCRNEWNFVTLSGILLGIMAFVLKLINQQGRYYVLNESHSFYCLSCFLAWVKLISFFIFNSKMGPLWIMLRKMFGKVAYFLLLYAVVTFSAGITAQVISNIFRYSDPYTGYEWLFLRPYFMFNGEKFMKKITRSAESMTPMRETMTEEEFMEQQESFRSAHSVLLAAYLWLGNALLMNILIAVFNKTFNEIFKRSHFEWKTEYFNLQREYESHCLLPAPLSIFEFILFVVNKFRRPLKSDQSDKISDLLETQWATVVLTERFEQKTKNELAEDALKVLDKQRTRLDDLDIILTEMPQLIREKRYYTEKEEGEAEEKEKEKEKEKVKEKESYNSLGEC